MPALRQSAPGLRHSQTSRRRAIKGGRKPGRRPGYFEKVRLKMEDDRRNLPLKSLAKVIAGSRRNQNRAGSILRSKRRKRSALLRKA